MPVPAHRRSTTRGRNRRSHDALKTKSIGVCKSCNAPVMPHRACPTCGSYKNRSVK
ncbi:50S ribosomal protein L32 [Candidatus Uhrbacteria bacterium]|nr:50S ribosomal protein L32 [Candidatus Uhrbacteria bacterium]